MLFYLALNERGHTMTPNKTPDQSPKPEWFELTENQTPSAGLRKVNKVLPITTLVVAGGLLLGGSLFANANNESSTPTENSVATQSAVASVSNNSAAVTPAKPTTVKTVTGANGLPMPVVTNVPQRGDDDDDEHEGRKRGDRERDHDDDDDRDEDEDDD